MIVNINGFDEYMDMRTIKEFKDFFDAEIHYSKELLDNPLPLNTMQYYVSNTFLNGFINYGTILKAYCIGRYLEWDEEVDDTSITKSELFEHLTDEEVSPKHTDFSKFEDDVIVLMKSKTGNTYCYFWYDRDTSDCSIGRFNAPNMTDEEVIELFEDDTRTLKSNVYGERAIPLNVIHGWICG